MDYLPQERARGITIRAAAITFAWQGFHMNLIDTPGHVDFSGEVERSLRVMDGSVVVVDASSGIQTQTHTVWMQAQKFHVPRVIFLNKMDLPSSSTELTCDQIKKVFNATPLLLQVPVFNHGVLSGSVDLVKMRVLKYADPLGSQIEILGLDQLDNSTKARAVKENLELLETLGTLDDEFAEKYLAGNFTESDIMMAIRKLTIRMQAFPILCGSALKNRGIQPVLDAVVNYLPSPAESPDAEGLIRGQTVTRSHKDKELCALAYKVIQNTAKGPLVYVRIYSGKIKHGEVLKNTTRKDTLEKVTKLLRVRSNEYVEVLEAKAGDIVAIGGMKDVYSGDTLIAKHDYHEIVLPGVKMPPPVFFCSIAAEEEGKDKELEVVLKAITREDPSYSASIDEETGQIFATGQGELHLEILRDRILSDYKLKARLGEMQVAYRESVANDCELLFQIDKPGNYVCMKLKLEKQVHDMKLNDLEDVIHGHTFDKILANIVWDCRETAEFQKKIDRIRESGGSKIEEEEYLPLQKITEEFKEKIIEDFKEALKRGLILGYPLINLKITVVDGVISRSRTNIVVINEGVAVCTRELLKKAGGMLYEPIMKAIFEIPDTSIGDLLADISSHRRGTILGINKIQTNTAIEAMIPLKELLGYTSILRGISRGVGAMTMTFHSYEYVGKEVEEQLTRR